MLVDRQRIYGSGTADLNIGALSSILGARTMQKK